MPVSRATARSSRSPLRNGDNSGSTPVLLAGALPTASTFGEVSTALVELRERGLVQSAAWLAELRVALLARFPSSSSSPTSAGTLRTPRTGGGSMRDRARTAAREQCVLDAARAYFDAREYARCAHALAHETSDAAVFLRLYARFLDAQRAGAHGAGGAAPDAARLGEVRDELAKREQAGHAPDGFLLYLRGSVERRLGLSADARRTLAQSVRRAPWNRGAWLELARVVRGAAEARRFAGAAGAHLMSALFVAGVCNETDRLEDALGMYGRVCDALPGWLFAAGQRALVLYNMRRFEDAEAEYERVFRADPARLEGADIYSNILFVKEDKAALAGLAARCEKLDKFRLETCCVIGNYFSLRQAHEKAVLYFQRALRLNPDYLSAWTLMGHEYVELKNTPAAVEAYRRAVDINPKDFRAWYGLGQTYELIHMPAFTLYYFQKAAALRPRDARMWCAVGQTLEELSRFEDAQKCYERAVRCDDPQGIALAKLAFLHEHLADVARDELQDEERERHYALAATYFSETLERRDEEGFGGPETARALKFLAKYAVDMEDQEAAEKFCQRLMDFHGSKDFAQNLLRQMHGHGVRQGDALRMN